MSKNIEEEYRRMIVRETPDLWNRIEAELPKKGKGRGSWLPYIRFAAGAAAAAAIVCIVLPSAEIGNDRIRNKEMSTERTGGEGIPDTGAVNEAVPEGTPEAEELASAGQQAPAGVNFNFDSESGNYENPTEVWTEERENDEESVEVTDGETVTDDDSGVDKGTLMASADVEHEDVPVSVTGVQTVNGGKFYTVKVLEDTTTGLTKGDEIVLKADDTEETLRAGSEYSVSLAAGIAGSSQTVSGNTAGIYPLCKVKENEKTEE